MRKEDYNYLRVKKQDWEQYCECLDKIRSHINKKEPVPKKLFAEYESLIDTNKTSNYNYYRPQHTKIYTAVLEYFKQYPEYQFTIINGKGISNEHMCFDDMISTITLMLLMNLSFNIGNTYKDKLLKNKLNYIIDFINAYCIECEYKYTIRQTYIMAGRVVIEFGYSLIGGKPLTNSNLFYAVRNAVKYKTKKPKNKS